VIALLPRRANFVLQPFTCFSLALTYMLIKKKIVTGSEVMAARICVRGEPMADCT
jgi:hypothetical protein